MNETDIVKKTELETLILDKNEFIRRLESIIIDTEKKYESLLINYNSLKKEYNIIDKDLEDMEIVNQSLLDLIKLK